MLTKVTTHTLIFPLMSFLTGAKAVAPRISVEKNMRQLLMSNLHELIAQMMYQNYYALLRNAKTSK